jgi:4-hydroxy-3-methylbut-2-en-1-yl diphosphate synthase IspG/GcpE
MTNLREEMLNKQECPQCREIKSDVCERTNNYDEEINNNPGSMWTACDECDYQNTMDI